MIPFRLTLCICLIFGCFEENVAQNVAVNAQRIESNFNKLKSFGDNQTIGNDRVAFSDYNVEALGWISDKLKAMGLTVTIDFAGNLIAKRKGLDDSLPPIGFGSHIDCVPNGGHYDGQVGVLGGIEFLEYITEKKIMTKHPLEFIIFSNEEGGVFGSRAIAGKINKEALEVMTASGYTNKEGMDRLGGNSAKVFEVARKKGAFHAFVELHIEQGGILEEERIDIGVVQGIVGLRWWDVKIKGFSNHAGTTPMNKRKDAMLAAAKFILDVNEVVRSFPGTQVGTVGRIKAMPGVPNVIPGEVVLSLELRDLKNEILDKLFDSIQEKAGLIEKQYSVNISFTPISATGEPALTSLVLQDVIENQARQLGYSSKRMPSGAGHDSQEMALIAPTGMLFVPSKGGISHSPEEFTSPEAIVKGVNVLVGTLLKVDTMESISY